MEKMSRLLTGNPTFLPPSNHGVLKSLLENPMKLPIQQGVGFLKEREKEKFLEEERNAPQSAFLGPTLWDKTLPYDGNSFQLEYMDLEEFLSENGIPSTPSHHNHQHQTPQHQQVPPSPVQHHQQTVQSQVPHQTSQPIMPRVPLPHSPLVLDFNDCVGASSIHTGMVPQTCLHSPTSSALSSPRSSPSPIDPESIHVASGYDPDPADLVLSSVPGQEMFDPTKRKFSAEELKPQPMIKKARKVLMPDDLKDDRYWARRKKNNMAAKRSRDARRLKENQIAIRAGFLEKENSVLRQEVVELRKELGRAKNVLAKYQARHGPL